MNIAPRQLRMFLTLSDTLNFSKAAEQLFISQPALTKAIQDLEEELGLTLFERTTRSVRLTEAGQQLADATSGAFDAIGTAFAGISAFSRRPNARPRSWPSRPGRRWPTWCCRRCAPRWSGSGPVPGSR